MQTYLGTIKNGKVVLPKPVKLDNGTPVLVMPQVDWENEWMTVTNAAKQFGIATNLVRQWMKSAKVRIHPADPKLVNAGDMEDAVEQHNLFESTMQIIERDDKK